MDKQWTEAIPPNVIKVTIKYVVMVLDCGRSRQASFDSWHEARDFATDIQGTARRVTTVTYMD